MQRRVSKQALIGLVPIALVMLSACGEGAEDAPAQVLSQDPQLARALNDPLMVDPDLAWRSEANAVVGLRDGHPLPFFEASDEASSSAREAARLALLENGQIPSLPAAVDGPSEFALGPVTSADAMVDAVGARSDCNDRLEDDLLWSDAMPPTSSLPPHAMVQQAAGVDVGNCVIRVVRYLTPVGIEDALEYHFTKVDRARFDITRFAAPEAQLVAERRDQKLVVAVREGPGGMAAVDVIHWRK